VRVRTSLKPRALCSHEIDLADLRSLRYYSKYLTTRHRQFTCWVFSRRNCEEFQHHQQPQLAPQSSLDSGTWCEKIGNFSQDDYGHLMALNVCHNTAIHMTTFMCNAFFMNPSLPFVVKVPRAEPRTSSGMHLLVHILWLLRDLEFRFGKWRPRLYMSTVKTWFQDGTSDLPGCWPPSVPQGQASAKRLKSKDGPLA
jgi:hypothetical protein